MRFAAHFAEFGVCHGGTAFRYLVFVICRYIHVIIGGIIAFQTTEF
jgi:hypothetical protein